MTVSYEVNGNNLIFEKASASSSENRKNGHKIFPFSMCIYPTAL